MKFFFVLILVISPFLNLLTQSISISPDGSPPDSSAILDIQSTTKGLLIPRMTQEQRDSIFLPVLGLTIFQTDGIPGMYYYDGAAWTPVGSSIPVGDWPQNGDDIYNNNPGNVGIGTSTPESKVHIKGAVDVSQLIIDASETQSNTSPLIRLRKSDGTDLMWIHTDIPENVFIGNGAGRLNDRTIGIFNTFIGYQSGFSSVSGAANTALGAYSFRNNTIGYHNTGIGFSALSMNTTGGDNTAIGNGALSNSRTASQNTAVGSYALHVQSYSPGLEYVSGNTAVGFEALYSNQPDHPIHGVNNTAVGRASMSTNTIGYDNTAIGVFSLNANTEGYDNTALGGAALYSNSVGHENTAVGRQALFYNTIGDDNTTLGYKSLRHNTTGEVNTASGSYALYNNTIGWSNSAYGAYSLYENTIGDYNTANGYHALELNTTGWKNTAIGGQALSNNITGNHNIALGFDSGCSPSSSNLLNTINIGNVGYLNQASNQIFIGNLSTTWTGGQTTWFTYASDARVKNNVNEDVKGLDFITKLRPVTYHLDITAMREITGNSDTEDYPEKYDIEKIKQSGFLAQEVEQAANDSGYNFNGYTSPKKNTELYTMSYSLFVVPLVKATQELNAKVEQLGKENQQLKSVIDDLLTRMETLEKRMD